MATLNRRQLNDQFRKQVAKSFSQPQIDLPPIDFYTFMRVYAATLANAGNPSMLADPIAKALKVYGSTDAEIDAVMQEVGLGEYQSDDMPASMDGFRIEQPSFATMSVDTRRASPKPKPVSAIDRAVGALTRQLPKTRFVKREY